MRGIQLVMGVTQLYTVWNGVILGPSPRGLPHETIAFSHPG